MLDKIVKKENKKFVGGLLGGGSKSSTQTTVKTLPDWLKPTVQDMVSRAETLSESPYVGYEGQRIADFSPDQMAAMQRLRDSIGSTSGLYTEAGDIASDLAQGITQGQIEGFMNPFQQNVIDIEKREALRNFDKSLANTRGRLAASKAFGGDRQAIIESELMRNTEQDLQDLQARGSRDAFNTAIQTTLASNAQRASGAKGLLETAAGSQASTLRDLQALLSSGGAQQQQAQRGLDVDYSDFTEEKNYPYNQLSFLSGIVNPVMQSQTGETATTTQKGGSGSMLGNLIGLGATALGGPFGSMIAPSLAGGLSSLGFGQTAYSLLGAAGSPTDMSSGIPIRWNQWAEGGQVKPKGYAEGGAVEEEPTALGKILRVLSAGTATAVAPLRKTLQRFDSVSSNDEARTGVLPIEQAPEAEDQIPAVAMDRPMSELMADVSPEGTVAQPQRAVPAIASGMFQDQETAAAVEEPSTLAQLLGASQAVNKEEAEPKRRSNALLNLGLAMLTNQDSTNFFEQFGKGMEAFSKTKEEEAGKVTAAKRQAFEDQIALLKLNAELGDKESQRKYREIMGQAALTRANRPAGGAGKVFEQRLAASEYEDWLSNDGYGADDATKAAKLREITNRFNIDLGAGESYEVEPLDFDPATGMQDIPGVDADSLGFQLPQ